MHCLEDQHMLLNSGSETIVFNGVNSCDRVVTKHRFKFIEVNTKNDNNRSYKTKCSFFGLILLVFALFEYTR